jgi:hypothetical protein
MKKNVFYEMKKNKNNPDILVKKKEKENERKSNVFKSSTTTYNSITNQIPNTVKTQKDLELSKDKPLSNIEKLIADKALERQLEEKKFKPVKQKLISNEENTIENNNFNDLKKEQQQSINEQKTIILNNKNKFNNLLNNLKSLSIIEK